MGTMNVQSVAEDTVTMVTEENQNETQVWYDKGILYTVYGNDQAAIPYFQKVIDINPRHSDAYFQLIRRSSQLGRYLALGDQVIVNLRGGAIKIGETGKESFSEAELQALL